MTEYRQGSVGLEKVLHASNMLASACDSSDHETDKLSLASCRGEETMTQSEDNKTQGMTQGMTFIL